MNISRPLRILSGLSVGILLMTGCDHSHDNGSGHGHPHGATEPEGHDHASETGTTLDTTIREGGYELFVEYPAFIKGEKSTFAAHLTDMKDGTPLKEGAVTAKLIKGNSGIRHRVEGPGTPGIFRPALQPKREGVHRLSFELMLKEVKTTFEAGKVRVFPDQKAAQKALEHAASDEGSITFTKEDAWKLGVQHARVRKDTLLDILKTTGEWKMPPGKKRTLTAGVEGNVLYAQPDLTEGRKVQKGELLMTVSGKDLNIGSIESRVDKAKAKFQQAKQAYDRKKELHELGVVPNAEWNKVKERYEVAKSNYQQLVRNYSAEGVTVKAPFTGHIKAIHQDHGAYAEPGQPLITLAEGSSRMVKASIDPGKREHVRNTQKIWVKTDDKDFREMDGEVTSIGTKVSAEKPLLPVFISLRTAVDVPEGSLAELHLGYGNAREEVLIPKDALLEDRGQYRVILQRSGESYDLVPVTLGGENGRWISIRDGLSSGQWVVTKEAYQVKMASGEGQAAGHGHAH